MNVIEAREAWLRAHRPEEWTEEDALRDAFAAGWNAARPTIYGTTTGNVSHNKAKCPGKLQVTVWGHTEDGQSIALVMSEPDVVALRDNLARMGVGLESQGST
jgi:hypothetical protein